MDRRQFLSATIPPALPGLTRDAARPAAEGLRSFNVMLPPFGAKGDGSTDDTRAIQAAIQACGHGTVFFPPGVYICGQIVSGAASLAGSGMLATTLKARDRGPVLELGFVEPHWAYRQVSGMTVDGNARTAVGVSLRSSGQTELPGRWVFTTVQFASCRKGVEKTAGNIGNAFIHCLFRDCDFGYHAVSNASPAMHSGNDTFDMCHLENNSIAAVYCDCTVAAGGALKLRETIIEANPGFGIFVNNFLGQYAPLVLDNIWLEANATSAQVAIDGVPHSPQDIYLRNVGRVNIVNGRLEKMRLVNSHALVDGAYLVYPDAIAADPRSSIIHEYPHLDFGAALAGTVQHAPLGALPQGGKDAPVWRINPRSMVSFGSEAVLASVSFAEADTYFLFGRGSVAAVTADDGLLFDACAEVTLDPGDAGAATGTHAQFAAGQWLAWTLDAKIVNAEAHGLSIELAGAAPMSGNVARFLRPNVWSSVGGIWRAPSTGRCDLLFTNGSAKSATLRLSAFQIATFDTFQEAVDFMNSGRYLVAARRPRERYSATPPASGRWRQGDRVWNAAPDSGAPVGWVCVASGSPGSWKAFGLIGN